VTHLTLNLDCEGGYPSTCFSFYVKEVSFEALPTTDLSGLYYSPDGEELLEGDAGTVDLGSLLELEGFSFPMGSYIMYDLGDYFIPDGMITLSLERKEDGTYIINGMMANADFSDFIMFADEETGYEIKYYDNTEDD